MKALCATTLFAAVLAVYASLLALPAARADEAADQEQARAQAEAQAVARQQELQRIGQAIVKLAETIYQLEQADAAAGGAAANKDKIAAAEKQMAELEAKQNLLHYQQTKAKYMADLAAGGAPSDVSPALNEVLRLEKQSAAAKEALRKVEGNPEFTITPEQKQKNAEIMADREKRLRELEKKAQQEVLTYITQQALRGRFPESAKPDSEFSKKLAAKAAEPGNKEKLEANPKYLLYLARMVAEETGGR